MYRIIYNIKLNQFVLTIDYSLQIFNSFFYHVILNDKVFAVANEICIKNCIYLELI
jgi:hypothetical protein